MSISHQQQNELRSFNHPHKNNTFMPPISLDFSQKTNMSQK